MKNRRIFLKTLAATGAAALVPRALVGQVRVVRLDVPGGAIDVHHHYVPPNVPAGGNLRRWTPDVGLAEMEKFGISVAILSAQQNGSTYYDGTAKGRAAVRGANEYAATLMQQYPARFGMMATLPLPDRDGSLEEIAYAYDTLKADAISIHTNDHHGRWPGDAHFEPVWQELNRRSAIVFVHPMAPTCCRTLGYGPNPAMLEFDFDVTRAVASIVVNGVMFRYPNIRWVTVHSGGTVPMLAGRMNDRIPAGAEQYLPNGLYAELRKWYYDIAHASFPWPFAAMKAFMPESQILFGTDFSPEPIESTDNYLPQLKLAPEFERMLLRGDARAAVSAVQTLERIRPS